MPSHRYPTPRMDSPIYHDATIYYHWLSVVRHVATKSTVLREPGPPSTIDTLRRLDYPCFHRPAHDTNVQDQPLDLSVSEARLFDWLDIYCLLFKVQVIAFLDKFSISSCLLEIICNVPACIHCCSAIYAVRGGGLYRRRRKRTREPPGRLDALVKDSPLQLFVRDSRSLRSDHRGIRYTNLVSLPVCHLIHIPLNIVSFSVLHWVRIP